VNWYRFKVELGAWAAKTCICVLAVLIVRHTLFWPPNSIHVYDMSLRFLAENEWIIRGAFWLSLVVVIVCYRQAFRIYRSRKAYGER